MSDTITHDQLERDAMFSEVEEDSLRRVYANDPMIRRIADELHHSRMMTGPACAQCIKMAVHQLASRGFI